MDRHSLTTGKGDVNERGDGSGGVSEISIFTDGACLGNPGPGGWAAVLVRDGVYSEYGGADPATTNNRMELTGVIEGLGHARPGEAVRVVSDSRYVIDGATGWIHGWMRRGWKKADGDPVANVDLWQALHERMRGKKIRWEYVAGHSGHPENERCDRIAQSFARGAPVELRTGDGAWIARDGAPSEPSPDEAYAAPLYLSLVDGDVREHATWGACEARIKGVRGARCKKVLSRREHVQALVDWKDLV